MAEHSDSAVATSPVGSLHPIARSRLVENKDRPNLVAVGTMIWLASELMFFAALFAAYFTIQNVTNNQAAAAGVPSLWSIKQELLNPPFALANTIVLVLSSVTCQRGVHLAEHGVVNRTGSLLNFAKWGFREWYVLTFVMGAFFVSGQIMEYAELVHHGLTISSDAYGSVFYLATGFHGLHVTGGLLAFLVLLGRTYLARTWTHEQAVSAVVVSYYWHFVDIVWIVLFAVIYGDPLAKFFSGLFG